MIEVSPTLTRCRQCNQSGLMCVVAEAYKRTSGGHSSQSTAPMMKVFGAFEKDFGTLGFHNSYTTKMRETVFS